MEEKPKLPEDIPSELVQALGMDQMDWFGSDIIDWVKGIFEKVTSLPQEVTNLVTDSVRRLLDLIVERIKDHLQRVISIITTAIEAIPEKIIKLLDAVKTAVLNQFEALNTFLVAKFIEVASALSKARDAIQNFIDDRISSLFDLIVEKLSQLYEDLDKVMTETGEAIIKHPLLLAGPGGIAAEVFKQVFSPIENVVRGAFETVTGAVKGWFDDLKGFITREIADPITDWFAGLTDRLISYFESFKNWISTWIRDLGRLIIEFFSEDFVQAVMNALEWVRLRAQEFFSSFWDAVEGLITRIGRITPERGPEAAHGLLTVVGITAIGLGIFTVAGRAMAWMAGHGLGNLAAIIGDVTNYRTLTAAWVGILATCMITTPLRYYYNYLFRPWIIDRGTIASAMGRNLFGKPENLLPPRLAAEVTALTRGDAEGYEKRLLGYHGFGDEYYAIFKELANTPARYFPLRMVADMGVYDEKWFIEELQRAGYSSTTIARLLDVFRRQALGEIKSIYLGTAINLYREGFITDSEMKMHLRALGVPEERLDQYAYAAMLAYEFDTKKDWLEAYKEEARKGKASGFLVFMRKYKQYHASKA